MKIRMLGMLAVSILTLSLSGCRDSEITTANPEPYAEIWEAPDGSYTLPLNANEWKVEEESRGELHFLNCENEKFSFSISRWEGIQFPPDFDYEGYYTGYVEDIRKEFPDAEEIGVEVIAIEDTTLVQMGVRYEVLEEPCNVTTSMITIPNSEDTLCFVAIYPAEKSKEQETIFRNIVTGIDFIQ